MGYNYIPKYIRQSETKRPKDVITAARWNELFNLLIEQGDYTAEELGKILGYLSTALEDLSTGLEDLTSDAAVHIADGTIHVTAADKIAWNNKFDKTGGRITGNVMASGAVGGSNLYADNGRGAVAIFSAEGTAEQTEAAVTNEDGDLAPLLVADPSDDAHAASKGYVDARAGGTRDHSQLSNRNAANQHSMSAITGLENEFGMIRDTFDGVFGDLNNKLSDAPSDGKQYVRKNGAWAEMQGGSGSMCVNVTASGAVYSADKTRDAIAEAIANGKFVYVVCNNVYYYYDNINAAFVTFKRTFIDVDEVQEITLDIYNDHVSREDITYASVLYVEVIKDGDNYISDKSYEDIRVAVKLRNQAAVVVYDEGFYPLTEISEDDNIALFSNSMVNVWSDEIMQNMFIITPDNVQVLENTWELNTGGGALVIDYSHPQSTDYNNAVAAFTAGSPVLLKKNNSQVLMTGYDNSHCFFGGTLSAYLPGGYVIAVYAHIGPNGENYFWYEYQSAIDGAQKPLIVNITYGGGLSNYIADKTNAEIYAAWQAGREVVASLNGGNSKILCVQADSTSAYFSLIINGDSVEAGTIEIATSGGTQTVNMYMKTLQSTTISDTAGYYTTDTVEGALAEIGGTLNGLEVAINTIRGIS